MLRINLLPTKVTKKQTTAKNELYVVLAGLGVVLVGLYAFYMTVDSSISDVQRRVSAVTAEVQRLKQVAVKVDDFKNKATVYEQKIGVIEKLKKQKVGPARMLDDLTTILTDERKVWLTSMVEKDGVLTIEGEAMEHGNISDFQIALTKRSKFFRDVKLDVVEATQRDGIPTLKWRIVCRADYAAG